MKGIMTVIGAAALLVWPAGLTAQASPEAMAAGAQVWATNCVRCHNARPSAERSDAQWTVIVSHMRARANLTRSQARTVTAFLQMTNPPEGGVPSQVAPPPQAPQPEQSGSEDGPPETSGEPGGSPGEAPALSDATLRQLALYLTRLGAAMEPPSR